MEEYALVKNDQLITLEGSLEIIRAVISYREKMEIKKASDSEGEHWRIYANCKDTNRSYCADPDLRRGYTFEEVQRDLDAKKLAKMFDYKIYQRL